MKNIKKHIINSLAVIFSATTLLISANSITSHAILTKEDSKYLFNTIQKGNVEEVNFLIKEIKEKRPEDLKKFVNSINENGDTLLQFAARKNQTEIAKILLENGAHVNINDISFQYAKNNNNMDLYNTILANLYTQFFKQPDYNYSLKSPDIDCKPFHFDR